jgi:hypothetical protein
MKPETETIRKGLVDLLQARFDGAARTDERKAAQERLWNMIQYAIGRHDYWDAYRTRYLTIATALMAVAAAASGILANTKAWGFAVGVLYVSFIVLAATGFLLVYRFKTDTSPDYPYRNEARVRSWIHLYTLGKNARLLDLTSQNARDLAANQYVNNLNTFTHNWAAMSEWEHMQEDLEQVLILYVLQAYKREFAKRMAFILEIGLLVFVALLGLATFEYLGPLLLSRISQ